MGANIHKSGKGVKCRSVVVTLSLSKSVRKLARMFRQAQHDSTHKSASVWSSREESRDLVINYYNELT